jgi:hypothetical protein
MIAKKAQPMGLCVETAAEQIDAAQARHCALPLPGAEHLHCDLRSDPRKIVPAKAVHAPDRLAQRPTAGHPVGGQLAGPAANHDRIHDLLDAQTTLQGEPAHLPRAGDTVAVLPAAMLGNPVDGASQPAGVTGAADPG